MQAVPSACSSTALPGSFIERSNTPMLSKPRNPPPKMCLPVASLRLTHQVKLMINFTWWVNRKDATGRHIFGGGFLGLDNIGVFDRSMKLPGNAVLEQADGTACMAFYCSTMLSKALEL